MPTWTKAAVDAWTTRAGVMDGFVFRPVHRGDDWQGDRLSEEGGWQLLRPYAAAAGGELEQIQLLLGHASVRPTMGLN